MNVASPRRRGNHQQASSSNGGVTTTTTTTIIKHRRTPQQNGRRGRSKSRSRSSSPEPPPPEARRPSPSPLFRSNRQQTPSTPLSSGTRRAPFLSLSATTTKVGESNGNTLSPLRPSRLWFHGGGGDNPSTASTSTATSVSSVSMISASHTKSIGSGNFTPMDAALLQQQNVTSTATEHSDMLNYGLLLVLYTLQGIPMGLSASIPFLIQQKIKALAAATDGSAASAAAAARLSYNANAVFALCSWPFSLKLLWAPIVDACYLRGFGRRKTWLVPVQALAGILMVAGADFVERQLGLGENGGIDEAHLLSGGTMNVKGVTAFFFLLYALMATQDIAVDGWALTMLSKQNRGRGPVCNSIGQNIGYFLSFVGFLALNDVESAETLWRPLLRLPSNPSAGIVSLGSFIRFMGYFMLVTTTAVALLKQEVDKSFSPAQKARQSPSTDDDDKQPLLAEEDDDDDAELDASQIGLRETYHRLWAVCKLPAVRWLFLILLTYRLPTALSDNVKFLKAVEFGLSKSTTALLSPTVILPLGILVPIVATRVWHGSPMRQFLLAYKLRVTLVPLLDAAMLIVLQRSDKSTMSGLALFWSTVIFSTAAQATCSSLQFNAQMTFFAHCVDPAIGGSYMTLLNTAANLGGTWPSSVVMWLIGTLTQDPDCSGDTGVCTGGRDPFFALQLVFSVLGIVWIVIMGRRVDYVASLPDDAWSTHLLDDDNSSSSKSDLSRRDSLMEKAGIDNGAATSVSDTDGSSDSIKSMEMAEPQHQRRSIQNGFLARLTGIQGKNERKRA